MNGKIICINKYIHRVLLSNNTIIDTRTRGKIRNSKITPVVGDNVEVDIKNKTIEKVLERKNYLDRPLIANIDKLLIVMSTSIPIFSSYLIDKFLLIAYSHNIEPIIIITKLDMISMKERLEIKKYISYYRRLGIKVYVNKSIKKIKQEFKHSVVLVELLEVNDGLIADTPGFSSLEINMNKKDIKDYYPDFKWKCKYRSCLHVKEDGCKIITMVEKNKIPSWRYISA